MAAAPAALDSVTSSAPHGGVPKTLSAARRLSWLLLPAAFALPVWEYALELHETSHYRFVWLFVLAAWLLAPSRVRDLGELSSGRSNVTWIWWGPAILFGLIGMLLAMPWFGAIGALLWVGGAANAIGGRPLMRALAPIWCCLWLAIRPPFDLDVYLIRELQTVTAQLADRCLDGFGQVHLLTVNAFSVAGKRWLVAEACSGVQMLWAYWACAWLLSLILRHGPLRWTLLLLSVPLWTIVTNAIGVVVMTLLWTERRIVAAEGSWHDALGFALFTATAGLIASTDCFFSWFFPRNVDRPPVRSPKALLVETKASQTSKSNFAANESSSCSRGAAICGGLLLTLQGLLFLGGERLLGDGKARLVLPELGAAALPETVGPWRRIGYEVVTRRNASDEGTFGQRWYYEGPAGKATVALDYPYAGWHELSIDYAAEGWELDSRNVTTTSLPHLASTTVLTTADYRREEEGLIGLLMFDLFDTSGNPLYETGDPLSFTSRLQRRLMRRQDRVRGARTTIQLRVFLESTEPPESANTANAAGDDERRLAAQQLFDAARARLTAACTAATAKAGF